MLSENRTHLLCQSVHFIICFSTEHIKEYTLHTTQKIIVMLTSFNLILWYNRILKGWFIGVINNLLNLLVLTANTFHHCLFIISKSNTIERYRVMRCIIR